MVQTASRLNAQAIDLASKGNFSDAILCLQEAIQIENDNYLLWFNLGVTYRDAGNYTMAIDSLKQAWALNQEDTDTIGTLALIYFNHGDIITAMNYCRIGIKANNKDCNLWNTLGVIYFNEANYVKAQECFELAVTINPYYYDALFNLRDTYEELGNKTGYESCVTQMKLIKRTDSNA